VVLELIQLILEDFEGALEVSPPVDMLTACLAVFTSLLRAPQPSAFLLSMYPTTRLFVFKFSKILFAANIKSAPKPEGGIHKRSHQVSHLAGEVFRQCTFYSKSVRTNAISVLYLILENNFAAANTLSYCQDSLTVSLSKMVATLNNDGEQALRQALLALPKYHEKACQFSDPMVLQKFTAELDTLLKRLSTILADSMEISRQTTLGDGADPATSENLLIQVADAFSHKPDVRIEWINRLAETHKKRENYAEAGQCYLMMSSLCSPDNFAGDVDDPVTASINAKADFYDKACKQLDLAELYEQCNMVYKDLIPIYEDQKDYAKLSKCHLHLHQMFDKLITANSTESRLLGTYYRVGFYGKKFGERLDGHEFVYKMPKITQLSEIARNFRELYSQQLGIKVKIHPNSGALDPNQFGEDEHVLQITFVSAVFKEGDERNSFIEKNTKLEAFKFSTPFTKSGKAFGDVTEQQKRNTIIYVKHEFPWVKTSQEVVRREETELSPMESCCEDVDLRVLRINEILSAKTISVKALTGLLAGSVATQVNGGARDICVSFLSPEANVQEAGKPPRFDPGEQQKLRQSMRDFLLSCQRALDVNKNQFCHSEQEFGFQAELDKQFDELCTDIRPLLTEPNEKKPKAHRGLVRFSVT